jgi:hypothetical protein
LKPINLFDGFGAKTHAKSWISGVLISKIKGVWPSMKGKIMTGLIVGALLFALLAVIGSSWMSGDEDGVEANYSLSEAEIKAELFGESITIEMDYGESCDEAEDGTDE